jgi:hypothetical protein
MNFLQNFDFNLKLDDNYKFANIPHLVDLLKRMLDRDP